MCFQQIFQDQTLFYKSLVDLLYFTGPTGVNDNLQHQARINIIWTQQMDDEEYIIHDTLDCHAQLKQPSASTGGAQCKTTLSDGKLLCCHISSR